MCTSCNDSVTFAETSVFWPSLLTKGQLLTTELPLDNHVQSLQLQKSQLVKLSLPRILCSPLWYVEHGGGRWLGELATIGGPQSTEYPEQGALSTAIRASDEQMHPRLHLHGV